MPKDIVDIFKNFWIFLKRFARDFYTLLKFRGHEFDERLQLKYPTTIRALIWLAITMGTIGIVIVSLSFISDFAFSKINLGQPKPSPTPVPGSQYEYR
jgi:hypothetical protein